MLRDGTRPAIPFYRVDGHQRMNLIIPRDDGSEAGSARDDASRRQGAA
jgi:hypothetical protein